MNKTKDEKKLIENLLFALQKENEIEKSLPLLTLHLDIYFKRFLCIITKAI